jgi:molybdate transport system substrate-binding protein
VGIFRVRIFALFLFLAGTAHADTVRVALASNFAGPMREIARLFELESGHRVELVVSSSGKIYAQIAHGAPFDVFLSADQAKPAALIADGLAVTESRFTYAVGRLVLWSLDPQLINNSADIIRCGNFRIMAIANPLLAPYGEAAMEVLQQLDSDGRLASKIVRGENIAQTFQFVATGSADLGFVALSQLQDAGLAASGSQWLVPGTMHGPIRQDAVLLNAAAENPAAVALFTFLQSEPIRTLILESGYLLDD